MNDTEQLTDQQVLERIEQEQGDTHAIASEDTRLSNYKGCSITFWRCPCYRLSLDRERVVTSGTTYNAPAIQN